MTNGKNRLRHYSVLDDLYRGPAFMIRRAHQIATAICSETWEELELTPSQYSVLYALYQCGAVGQNELGRLVSLDRCTTSVVVGGLSERGLTSRREYPNDKRKVLLRLTSSGRQVLIRAERLSTRASEDLMSVFTDNQARVFIDLLGKFNRAHETQRFRPIRSGS